MRGLFSPLNTAYASAAISPGAYVCHADLLAQIADVQQSHLRSLDSVSSSAAGSSFGPDNRMDANLSLLSPGNHGQSQSKSHNLHQTQSNGSSLDQDRDNGHNYEAHQQAVLSTAMLPPREKFWTQLSGSADLLTVLAYSEIDLLTMTAAVHVRVFNSSGFKIPTFALHLVASADLLSVDHTQGLCAHTAPLGATMAGSAASVVTQTQQHLLLSAGQGFSLPPQAVYFDESCVISAPGVDFFLPEAYVERTLTCKVRQFAPFEAVVRIVYADLVYDEDNIFEIPQDGNLGTSRAGGHHKSAAAKKSKSANANASSRGARYMEEYKDNQSNKWSAVLDCAPLRVPISAQLLPYGFGTCSAMSYWYQHHQSNHGRTVISELHSPGTVCFINLLDFSILIFSFSCNCNMYCHLCHARVVNC